MTAADEIRRLLGIVPEPADKPKPVAWDPETDPSYDEFGRSIYGQ